MSTLTAEELADKHPNLPSGWRMSMHSIKARGGPWRCPACDGVTYIEYRCSQCGHDLVGGR